jgi:hypothetical protein
MPQLAAPRADPEGPIDWGTGELLAVRLAADGGPHGAPGRPGLPTRHLRASASPPSSTASPTRRAGVQAAQAPVDRTRRQVLTSTTRCSASTRRWASSTATRSPDPTRWCCGRRSSATSSTARRRSSTSSSPPASQVGPEVRRRPAAAARLRGPGPDHSSARIERFLQLCAEDTMTCAMPSTPASATSTCCVGTCYGTDHRPLVIFTPKSMLRNKQATVEPSRTSPQRRSRGSPPLLRPDDQDPSQGHGRVLLCSGKVRWDLVAAARASGLDGSRSHRRAGALYPLPGEELAEMLKRYGMSPTSGWVQDEPENQGGWPYLVG